MTQHIFTCKCGCRLPVRLAQAGDQVTCPQCNEIVPIPSLREQNLPVDSSKLQKKGFLFLPEKTLPSSTWRTVVGLLLLAMAIITPISVALGLFENAFSYLHSSDPRRNFFKLDNPGLWTGLALNGLVGAVTFLRGLGYAIGGLSKKHMRP